MKFKIGDRVVPTKTYLLTLGYFAQGKVYEIIWIDGTIYETDSGHGFFKDDEEHFVLESVYKSKLYKALK